MNDTIISLETVAERLAVATGTLIRYEQLGLIQTVRQAEIVGVHARDVRRIWSIVSFQRDLGVNLAGVEVILRMQEQRDDLRRLLGELAHALAETPDPGDAPEGGPDAPK